MARAAYRQAAKLSEFGTDIVGVGATCALATDRQKRGDHKAFITTYNGSQTRRYALWGRLKTGPALAAGICWLIIPRRGRMAVCWVGWSWWSLWLGACHRGSLDESALVAWCLCVSFGTLAGT
jgi:hypothetical protein